MEIMKFENFNEKDYPENITGLQGIRYFISTYDDKQPWLRNRTSDLEEALQLLGKLQEASFNKDFCIYEGNFKVLSKEDIKIRMETRKYNL